MTGQNMKDLYQSLPVWEDDRQPLSGRKRLAAMEGPLLGWYERRARILPWREEPTPYRVWVSEIMLQQTRVEAVKPYFRRFMEELPDIESLAAAPEERLLKLWEGLGYYNRVRNLQKAARILVEDFGGNLPEEYGQLLKLPGIGSYTAGAIASIAYGKPFPAVDGNVLRVLSRVLAIEEDIGSPSVKRRLEAELKEVMPQTGCSAYNQALIEVGALVCVPGGQPKCGECPLGSVCLAGKQGLWDRIPCKAPKKPRRIKQRTILLFVADGRVAIRKRPDTGLLASMYEFPGLEGNFGPEALSELLEQKWPGHIAEIRPACSAVHIFSHVEWHMTGYVIRLDTVPDGWLFASPRELSEKYPLPGAFNKYINLINGEL